MSGMVGGYSNTEITQEHKDILNQLVGAVNEQLSTNFESLTITSVQQQVVAGMNYKFEVESNDGKKATVVVHRPLPHTQQPPKILEAKLL